MSTYREAIRYEHGTDDWNVSPESQSAPIFKLLAAGWYIYPSAEIEAYERCPVAGPFESFAAAQLEKSRRYRSTGEE